MKRDIKNFEQLVNDFARDQERHALETRKRLLVQLKEHCLEMDALKIENSKVMFELEANKEIFSRIDKQLGWTKYNLDTLLKATEDLPMTEKMVRQTERFLHKILPLRTQVQIFKAVKCVAPRDQPQIRLDLFEHTKEEVDYLMEIEKDEDARFDKKRYEPLDLDIELAGLREKLKPREKSPKKQSEPESSPIEESPERNEEDAPEEKEKEGVEEAEKEESEPVSDTSSLPSDKDEEEELDLGTGKISELAGKVVEEILQDDGHLVALTQSIGMVMSGQMPSTSKQPSPVASPAPVKEVSPESAAPQEAESPDADITKRQLKDEIDELRERQEHNMRNTGKSLSKGKNVFRSVTKIAAQMAEKQAP